MTMPAKPARTMNPTGIFMNGPRSVWLCLACGKLDALDELQDGAVDGSPHRFIHTIAMGFLEIYVGRQRVCRMTRHPRQCLCKGRCAADSQRRALDRQLHCH